MAGNLPFDLRKEKPIRPNEEIREQNDEAEKQLCEVDDEMEINFGGEEADRLKASNEGNQFVKKMIDPRLPNQKDVEEHNLTHLPYRNWCPVCVRSKGKEMGHRTATDKERIISEYCFDYCFPGDEFGFKLTVLAGQERLGGMKFATAVPTKGASGKFATDKCLDFIEDCGDSNGRIIIKNDQEPSMQFVIDDLIAERKEGGTIIEESPVKGSGSNGIV